MTNNETKPEVEHTCETCGNFQPGYDVTMKDDECGGCCSFNDKWVPKDPS